ncbi:MAG: hypothetical protein JST64_06160 [Actinobacteria bacterium]|nr:hypothetical protein [Actinomycetota bacterium]
MGLLTALQPRLAPSSIVVAESDRVLGADAAAVVDELGGTILRERRHGGTVVTMIEMHPTLLAGPGDAGSPEVDPR